MPSDSDRLLVQQIRDIVVEINDEILKKGMASIESFLEKGKARGKVTDEQIATVKKNLSTSTQLGALKDAIYRDLMDRIRTEFERGA